MCCSGCMGACSWTWHTLRLWPNSDGLQAQCMICSVRSAKQHAVLTLALSWHEVIRQSLWLQPSCRPIHVQLGDAANCHHMERMVAESREYLGLPV